MTPYEALKEAIAVAGGQSALARICDVSQTAIWKWVQSTKQAKAECVLAIEKATGVSRHDLRPDIYPRPLRRASDQQVSEYGDADDGNQMDILDYTQGATL